MRRIFLLLAIAAPLLVDSAGSAAHAAVRGNLVFDNIPEPPAGSTERLDAYLSARQATPLGWSPKGELLIATRFGDVDQLHVVDHAGGKRRQITFLREPITYGAFSPDTNRSAFVFSKDVGGNRKRSTLLSARGRADGADADRRQVVERRCAVVQHGT